MIKSANASPFSSQSHCANQCNIFNLGGKRTSESIHQNFILLFSIFLLRGGVCKYQDISQVFWDILEALRLWEKVRLAVHATAIFRR